MKTYFIRTPQTPQPRQVFEALRQAVIERENVREFDSVFALSYDRADQFFVKANETIYWGKIFTGPAGFREISNLNREIHRLINTFQHPVMPFVFFQELTSGHALLKTLPAAAQCFEYSFLKSDGGTALALKDLHQKPLQVLPPGEAGDQETVRKSYASSPLKLSRSEMAELMDLSLDLKRLPPA